MKRKENTVAPRSMRGRSRIGRRAAPKHEGDDDLEWEPLSPAWRQELLRRLREAEDPTRYVIVSPASGRRMMLYYDAVDGSYPVNDLARATHFKSRIVAKAVMKALGRRHVLMTVRLGAEGAVKRITPLRDILAQTVLGRRSSGSAR